MPTTCEIEFENSPLKVVYSGQTLRGNVKFTLTNSIKVQGACINISGEGYCHWKERSGGNEQSYMGREEYIDKRIYLIDGEEVRLTPGTHNYTFECMLPRLLPTSFEGEYGHIRYAACVVLDVLLWPQKVFPIQFTVIKPVNLNANRALRAPVVADMQKTFYPCSILCGCESGPLDISVHVPVGGYTPGQTINLYILVNNKTTQRVNDFLIEFVKEIRYKDHPYSSYSKIENEILFHRRTGGGCGIADKATLRANIAVPPISPTQRSANHVIIQIEYKIKVTGILIGYHKSLTIELPIVIGTSPIEDNLQVTSTNSHRSDGVILQQPTSPQHDNRDNSQSSAPILNDDLVDSDNLSDFNNIFPPPYPNDEPPTYEEAIQSGKKERVFVPKYPVFRRQTSYSNSNSS